MISRDDLVGEWELKEFFIEKPDGSKSEWGKNSKGLLIYTSSGYMSVSINRDVEGDNTLLQNKFNGILSYSGTYEVKENSNIIIHNVTNASDINRIGKEMIREANLDENKLKLIGRGDFGVATIIWNRLIKKNELKKDGVIARDSPLICNSQNRHGTSAEAEETDTCEKQLLPRA